MPKLFINTALYSFYVQEYLQSLSEFPEDEDLQVIINTPGGSVHQGWLLCEAFASRAGRVDMKIAGMAASMGVMFPLYSDYCEALDVSDFMLHRADMYVSNEEDQKFLDKVNKNMYNKLKEKIDDAKLKQITGFSLKDIFESEKRIDVWITAKNAKDIGLIDKVVKLQRKSQAAAFFDVDKKPVEDIVDKKDEEIHEKDKNLNNQNNNSMTLAELKSNHPDLYNQIFNEGVSAEKERCEAWMEFSDVDPEAVKKGIENGKDISRKEMAAFSRKIMEAGLKKNISGEEEEIETTDDPDAKTKEQKELDAFDQEVKAEFGLTDKKS